MVNKVILIGNLGADPEVRVLPSGTAVGNIRLATTGRVKRDGEWQDETEWHRVVLFGQMAENAAKHLKKGRQVFVEGRIRTNQWEDRDGVKRYTTEIVANELKYLGANPDRVHAQAPPATDVPTDVPHSDVEAAEDETPF